MPSACVSISTSKPRNLDRGSLGHLVPACWRNKPSGTTDVFGRLSKDEREIAGRRHVLAVVFLMAVFLFVVDVFWIKILQSPPIKVLLFDPSQERVRQSEQSQW